MSTIYSPNPLPASVNWELVERTLGVTISPGLPEREVVLPTGVTEGKPDFLRPVGQKVDSLGEVRDRRVVVRLEWDGQRGGLLALLDSLKDEVLAGGQVHLSLHSSVSESSEGSEVAGSTTTDSATSQRRVVIS